MNRLRKESEATRYHFIHSYVKRAHRSYKLKDKQASSIIDHTTPVQARLIQSGYRINAGRLHIKNDKVPKL